MEESHKSLVMVVVRLQLHSHQPWEQTCISGHDGTEQGHGQGSLVPARAGQFGTDLQHKRGIL